MTPTPNPTAESIIAEAMVNAGAPLMHSRVEEAVANALRAHNLLSEGAPSEEQIAKGVRACIESAAVPTGMRADIVCDVPIIRERVDIEDVVEVVLTAAGVAPQEPQALDPEKVAEELLRLMRDEAMLFDNGSEEWIAESDPVECLPPLARALCVAYTEGKLT